MTEVNCKHLSDGISKGTPKREIHTAIRAWAHVKVVVSRRGMDSSHRVVLSTLVKRYDNPLYGGRGPTKSMLI